MTGTSRLRVREVRLYFHGPPSAVLDRFEEVLARAGPFVFARTPWSLAAAPRVHAETLAKPNEDRPARGIPRDGLAIAGSQSPGPGTLGVGGAQLALVPVQGSPAHVRAWLSWVPDTGTGESLIDAAIGEFLDKERDGSRAVQVEVDAAERGGGEATWAAQMANLHRALVVSGVATGDIEARLSAMRARWLAARRGADAADEVEPPVA